jgi:hypothetical protein
MVVGESFLSEMSMGTLKMVMRPTHCGLSGDKVGQTPESRIAIELYFDAVPRSEWLRGVAEKKLFGDTCDFLKRIAAQG